jgi:putative PIN family toxin of toxin-antitoxin system
VRKVQIECALLFSEFTMRELQDALFRPKFDRYVSRNDRARFLAPLAAAAEFVSIIQLVRECRDPNDDKVLEVAWNGRTDVIITGDADLPAMDPWREIGILMPTDHLRR